MKKHTTGITVILLLALSALIYSIQISLFHDGRDTYFYLLQDWAFLPVQIVVVTIVVGKIISAREKRERIDKTRTLSSAFFSELGTELLHLLLTRTENAAALSKLIQVDADWTSRDFSAAAAALESVPLELRCQGQDFSVLRELLSARRMSLLVITSNPVLLEHESCTDLLWAVFHLSDELLSRQDCTRLSQADLSHLNEDAKRVLRHLLVNWLCHMDHIRAEYPYLFVLEQKKNACSDCEAV